MTQLPPQEKMVYKYIYIYENNLNNVTGRFCFDSNTITKIN
jgi:hypothetical protein